MPETRSRQVNLLDFLAFLLRWRRFLIATVLGVAGVAVIVSFVVKPSYRSTAVIHAMEQQSGGYGGLIASKLSMLSGITGMGSMFGATPGEMLIQILRSRLMAEKLIAAFDLQNVYRMKDAKIEQVIQALKGHTRYELDATSQSVVIYTMDTDPRRSQAMTQFMVDELDKRNQELRSTSARREREFIGQRLEEARKTLTALEDSMTNFQMLTGVLNVNEQVKATLGAVAQIEAQRLAVQTELEMNQQIFSPQNPEVAFLRLKISSLDSTLRSLSRGKEAGSSDVLMHLQDTPREAVAYLRLTRDIEIQQLLVGFLIQEFEQAKIEELRDTPTIMRIDPPVVATEKAWPKRSLMVAVGAAAALVFGIAFALIHDYFHEAAADPTHPQHPRLLAVRRAWNEKRA